MLTLSPKNITPIIKYRMWDSEQKKMFSWENQADRLAICTVLALNQNNPTKFLMPFANFVDDKGKEIYNADVCELTIQNEFLSFTKEKAVMTYVGKPYFGCCFMLENDASLGGVIVGAKYLGNVIENRGIMKGIDQPNNDNQSISGSNKHPN